ncbi:MAG TPA: hypothetical protein PKN30_11030 [Flavobacteriales bacterium]|nr:hypothetical protein [Flavobacteriales bacterium]
MSTKQVFGRELINGGYLNDSMGLALDPSAIYTITFVEYTEVLTIYRVGIMGKRKQVELKRRAA